jgi:hypothetical protein
MNIFLNVSRTDYIWDKIEFQSFVTDINRLVRDLNKNLRNAWKYGAEISRAIVTPFQEIGGEKGSLKKTKDTLNIIGIDINDAEAFELVKEKLNSRRSASLEREELRIDVIACMGQSPITLANDENKLVLIDPSVDSSVVSTKSIEAGTFRPIVKISPSLFSPRKVIFLDKTFEVIFIAGLKENPGVSIDFDGGKIFINPFNQDIMRYTVSFTDVYIAIEMAHALADNKDDMKNYLKLLMGASYQDSTEYLKPLFDDLQRKKRSRRI